MAVRKVLLYPHDDTALRKKSLKVKKLDESVKTLIQDLKDTLATQPGAGLSAVQIGEHWRVAVVRFGQDSGTMQDSIALINPQIIKRGAPAPGFDGCLSIPKVCTWDTPRPSWLVFTARDEDWKPIEMRVEGIDARLLDHEIDHMDGKLFLDLMTPEMKLYVVRTDENGEEKLVEIKNLIKKPGE